MQPFPRAEAPQPGDSTWSWTVGVPRELAAVRHDLRRIVEQHTPAPAAGLPLMASACERLALIYSELAANGLRHAAPPVTVRLSRTGTGWVIDVQDGSPASPPTPRAAHLSSGGHGLRVVLTMSDHAGWWAVDGSKHVWALVADEPSPALLEVLSSTPTQS